MLYALANLLFFVVGTGIATYLAILLFDYFTNERRGP